MLIYLAHLLAHLLEFLLIQRFIGIFIPCPILFHYYSTLYCMWLFIFGISTSWSVGWDNNTKCESVNMQSLHREHFDNYEHLKAWFSLILYFLPTLYILEGSLQCLTVSPWPNYFFYFYNFRALLSFSHFIWNGFR